MRTYKKIENLYEDFQEIGGRICGNRKVFPYVAPDSIHSGITKLGYGERLELPCVDATCDPVDVAVTLKDNDFVERRYYVRLTACMPDWRKRLNHLQIKVNGEIIYDYDKTLFENVCVGWPVTYYPFSTSLLKKGENVISVSTSNNTQGGLYVANVSLISLPRIKEGMQLSSIRYAKINTPFTIAVCCKQDLKVIKKCNLEIKEIKRSELDNSILLIKCIALSKRIKLKILCGDTKIALLCPQIVDASDDEFLIGMDNDDNRQDYSEEGDRVPSVFALTGMGNFFQFRPTLYRSVAEEIDDDTWRKRTRWLYDFDIKLSLSDPHNKLAFLEEVDSSKYVGKHCHETYLYFSNLIRKTEWGRDRFCVDMEKIERAETFGECKELYLEALDKMVEAQNANNDKASVGAPSLMVVYESTKFSRLTMEPVSGVNLLLAATRGSCKGEWGAHIPISWYYGYFNDTIKSRKYWTTMAYCYLNGARYVYAENGLFKSQSMSREDWDTKFSKDNRMLCRNMYDYSMKHPRIGELQIPFAAVFGNNEFILWQKDSRIPELEDAGDWDLNVWGKWPEKNTYLGWRAIDCWLPTAQNQNTVDDKFNLALHSGTKFGCIDVIPYGNEYSKYKLIAFLGWNTYEDKLSEKLYDYVKAGGNVFISYCHFNKTDNCFQQFEYAEGANVYRLLGFDDSRIVEWNNNIAIDEKLFKNEGGVQIVIPDSIDAKPMFCDEAGNVILYERTIGKGKLYFCSFAVYFGYNWSVSIMKEMLEKISYSLCDSFCTNKNIAYTERVLTDGRKVFHCMNMSTASEEKQKFTIHVKKNGKFISKRGSIGPCEIKEIIF